MLRLAVHPGLAGSTRLPLLSQEDRIAATEFLALLGAGACAAAATVWLDFGLRVPGHAIMRVVFPMSLGLALVPRRMSGAVMGAGSLATAGSLAAAGLTSIGPGALVSLVLTGPLMDLALWRARRGWRVVLGFALAGLMANLIALAVRAAPKLAGLEHAGKRPFALWWPQAVGTYALCGLLAGAVSAFVWFQFASRPGSSAEEEPAP